MFLHNFTDARRLTLVYLKEYTRNMCLYGVISLVGSITKQWYFVKTTFSKTLKGTSMWKKMFLVIAVLLSGCAMTGVIREKTSTSLGSAKNESVKAINILGTPGETGAELELEKMPEGTLPPPLLANRVYQCEKKIVLARKENGNVVVVLLLRDKLLVDVVAAIQVEMTCKKWESAKDDGSAYFEREPMKQIGEPIGLLALNGDKEEFPFYVQKGIVD